EVYICGRRGAVVAETARELAETPSTRVTPSECDIRSPDAVENMMTRVFNEGPLTGLVNNAAGNFISRTKDLSPNSFNAIANIVFHGTFYVTLAAGKRWIEARQQANVVSILTTSVWNGGPFTVPSAMSKAGIDVMTRSLAVEWAPHLFATRECVTHKALVSPQLVVRRELRDYPSNTTRPKGRSSIRWRRASAASCSLYARSTTGSTLPEVSSGRMMAQAAALIACDCANSEKPLMLACFQIKSVTSIVVSRPAEYPSEVRTPPRASVASACPVRAPPTLSMTTSTPRRPVRRATPSVRLSAERSMTLSKPRARACSALAGLVVVEIAFVAPCTRANWVTALPTAPPIAGASTVLPGSKPACVSVICAVR